jgi:hypothetical protein
VSGDRTKSEIATIERGSKGHRFLLTTIGIEKNCAVDSPLLKGWYDALMARRGQHKQRPAGARETKRRPAPQPNPSTTKVRPGTASLHLIEAIVASAAARTFACSAQQRPDDHHVRTGLDLMIVGSLRGCSGARSVRARPSVSSLAGILF